MSKSEASGERGDLFDRLSGWIDHWLSAGNSELSRLSDAEVARVAHDIGLSQSDLQTLSEQTDDASLLLYDRLKVLGLDPARLAEAGYLRDLQRTCGMCDSKGVCAHDLQARPEFGEWADYCPNSNVLRQVHAQRDG